MKQIRFRLTAYTDPAGKWDEGAPNKGNEDNLFVDANLSSDVQGEFLSDSEVVLSKYGTIMVVADGMGGMNAGEVASAIAIDVVKRCFKRDVLSPEIVSSSAARERYMERVVSEADIAIKSEGAKRKECEGMGSTIILAWLCGGELSVTWCGDSRVYLFREPDGLHQVSKDHSYVQGLVDSKQITEEEAFDHPYGNIITRSLGDPEKKAQSDSLTIPVYKGDIILVCSDGLSGVLRDRRSFDRAGALYPGENMEDIIRANRSSMAGCREALWKAAESAGWYDNVTAILCEITAGNTYVPPVRSGGDGKDSMADGVITLSFRKKSLYHLILAVLIILLILVLIYIHRNSVTNLFNRMFVSPDTTSVSSGNAEGTCNCGCANSEAKGCISISDEGCECSDESRCGDGCTCGVVECSCGGECGESDYCKCGDECECVPAECHCGGECGESDDCKCGDECECSDESRCGDDCKCVKGSGENRGGNEVKPGGSSKGKGGAGGGGAGTSGEGGEQSDEGNTEPPSGDYDKTGAQNAEEESTSSEPTSAMDVINNLYNGGARNLGKGTDSRSGDEGESGNLNTGLKITPASDGDDPPSSEGIEGDSGAEENARKEIGQQDLTEAEQSAITEAEQRAKAEAAQGAEAEAEQRAREEAAQTTQPETE